MKDKLPGALLLGLCLFVPMAAWAQDAAKDKKDDETKLESIRFEDKLSDADARDKVLPNGRCKVHVVKLTEGRTYQIDLVRKDRSQMYDPFLRIEDADGKELDKNDDWHGSLNSRIMLPVKKTGNFRIIATSNFGIGDYILAVAEIPVAGIVPLGAVGPKGLSQTGKVVRGSPPPRWGVTLAEKKTYIIEMVSTNIYTHLNLADDQGNMLAQDRDSGGDLYARIRFTAPTAGQYVLTSGTPGEGQGEFTLTIREGN